MGSAALRSMCLAVVLALLVASLGPVSGQGDSTAGPTKLWSFDPPGGGAFNDVAVDATGSVVAAVAANDPSITNFDDDEVFAWDLAASKTSREPVLQHDPRSALTAPEGMGVVALAPMPTGKADLAAVGREGSQAEDQNNIYLYQISRGPGTSQGAKYPGTDNAAPPGAVRGLWFSESGSLLLAHHVGALSLLRQTQGTEFEQVDRWDVPSRQTVTGVAVTRDLTRVVVATTEDDPTVGPDRHRIHVRTVEGDEIKPFAETLVREKDGDARFSAVAISEEGDFIVAGARDRVLFYYQLKDGTDLKRFSVPWSRSLPGAVTAVGVSERGDHIAAGYEGGGLLIYRQSKVEEEGPLAERAIKEEVSVQGAPSKIVFANNGTALIVQAAALYGFNTVQFDPNEALEPLWLIPGATGVAVSRDGNRFVAAFGQRVEAYEQSYRATLSHGTVPEATPGDTLSLEVDVANTGSAFDEYTLDTRNVPAAWSVEVHPDRFQLLPGETRRVLFNLTPAMGHAPGDVSVKLEALSRFAPGDDPIAGVANITVPVKEVHAAGLETDESDFSVTRGADATFSAVVSNTGNVEEPIVVEVRQERNWDVTIEDQPRRTFTTTLEPGEEATIEVSLAVPTTVSEGSTNQLTLEARPEGGGSSKTAKIKLIVEPDFAAAISGPSEDIHTEPGAEATFSVTVANAGNTDDTLTVRVFSNATNAQHLWEARASNVNLELGPGQERSLTITVNVPRGAEVGDAADVTVAVRSAGSGLQEDAASFRVVIPEETDDSPFPLWLVPLTVALAALWRRRRTP